MKIVLDTNIYDQLDNDPDCLSDLIHLIEHQDWIVLAPATLVDELKESPFGGIPDWLTVNEELDSVFILGHTKLGAGRLGEGSTYSQHKGESKQIKDAVIVDFAVKEADAFVSEDKRALKRLKDITSNVATYTFSEFKNLTRHSS